jgi:hypothetical protein
VLIVTVLKMGRGASRAGNARLKLTDEPREVYGCSVDIMGCGDQYSKPRISMDYWLCITLHHEIYGDHEENSKQIH